MKKPEKPKAGKMFALYSRWGYVYETRSMASELRKWASRNLEHDKFIPWATLYRRGWRVVRVRITPVKEGKK